eukprot:Em0009g933a
MQPLEYSIAVLGKIHFPPNSNIAVASDVEDLSLLMFLQLSLLLLLQLSLLLFLHLSLLLFIQLSCYCFQLMSLLLFQLMSHHVMLIMVARITYSNAKDRKVARVKENLTEDGFRRVKPLFWKGVKGWIKVLLPAWNLPDDKVLKKLLSLPSGPFDDKDGADAEGTVHRTIKDEASKSPRKKAGCDKPQREKQKTSNTTFDWSKPLLKWSKPQLQTYLAEHNLRTSGNKPELIE